MHQAIVVLLLAALCFSSVSTVWADESLVLSNPIVEGKWTLDAGLITSLKVTNRHTSQTLPLTSGHMPRIVLSGGRTVDLATIKPDAPVHRENNSLAAAFHDDASGLQI